jgi:hypothetical protein
VPYGHNSYLLFAITGTPPLCYIRFTEEFSPSPSASITRLTQRALLQALFICCQFVHSCKLLPSDVIQHDAPEWFLGCNKAMDGRTRRCLIRAPVLPRQRIAYLARRRAIDVARIWLSTRVAPTHTLSSSHEQWPIPYLRRSTSGVFSHCICAELRPSIAVDRVQTQTDNAATDSPINN